MHRVLSLTIDWSASVFRPGLSSLGLASLTFAKCCLGFKPKILNSQGSGRNLPATF